MAARTCAILSTLAMVTLLCPAVARASVDTDNDDVPDDVELSIGTDPNQFDTDGDGLSDAIELSTTMGGNDWQALDSDGDGMPDALDLDSDDDGVPDAVEGIGDVDGDDIRAFRDWDDDNDGINTSSELIDAAWAKVSDDVDGDGLKNWEDADADGDGTPDQLEGRSDSDKDGVNDYLDGFENPTMEVTTPTLGERPDPVKPGGMLDPTSIPDPAGSTAPKSHAGGCSTSGANAGAGLEWLLGIAAIFVARRRRVS